MNKLLRKYGRQSLFYQFFRKMKLTILIVTVSILSCFSAETYSQNTKLTIAENNSTLLNVLKAIEAQSEFKFFYNEKVDVSKQVSVEVTQKSVTEILDKVLSSTSVKYKVLGRQIALYDKEEMEPFVAEQQGKKVTGKVTDQSGVPIPGAAIVVKGTTIGITSDSDGNFALSLPSEAKVIVFSFIGMKSQEIDITGKTSVNIIMEVDAIGIEEVVAVGYGVQKKANLTGAVATVNSKELVAVTSPDFSNALSGKLPGLRVQTLGSEPGVYDNQIDIRGWGSMLVVVDGIPRWDFQRIDPSTIDNVSILKDASAAVYGVKAANGVMLITTKKGKAGNNEITLNSSFGFEQMTDYPRAISNSIDNLILKNEAALVAGNPLPFPDYKKYTGEDPNYPSVDYWKLTVRDKMPMSKNDVSFSGGTEKITYYISLGNLHQTGIYKTNSMNYDRNNFRANLSAEIVKGLTANVIFGGMMDKRDDPYGGSSYDFMKQVWMQPPYEPVYANNTSPYYYDGQADRNPVAIINSDLTGSRQYQMKKFETTMSLAYDVPFITGLKVKGLFAYDVQYNIGTEWRKAYNEYKYDVTAKNYIPTGINNPTQLRKSFDEYMISQYQVSLEYKKSFAGGQHNIESLLLVDRRNTFGDGFGAQRYFSLDAISQIDAGLTDNQVTWGSNKILDGNMALVGRLNYNYRSKYLTELSFRYDGSSLFPAESRWGFFPAISLGWRISEEPFIKDNFSSISNLKLRMSHGVMGDDSGAGGFQYISGYNYPSDNYIFDGKTLTSGSSSKGLANPNITWYTATTSNIGVDGNLWEGLLDFTVELFQRKREGLLSTRAATLPSEFGASFPQENLNSDLSQGFEFVVGHSNKINEFSYNIRTNLSFTQQKWLHYEQSSAGNSYLNWTNTNENRLQNMIWGYGAAGQFQTQDEINTSPVQNANGHAALFPGDVKYVDWNEDGMIDGHDRYPIAHNEIPKTFFGAEMSGAWKGLSLSLLFQGATGYSQTPTEQLMGPLPWGRNSLTIFLDRWHHVDPLDFNTPWVPGKYPISRDGFGFGPNKETSTYWVVDATYVRLKSIELAYVLPVNWAKRIKAKQVRVYTNAFNLLTWKSKGVLFDPEHRGTGDGGDNGYKYPVMASYNLGLSITF